MTIKVAFCVIGASFAMLGCAHQMTMAMPQTCSSAPCNVDVARKGWLFTWYDLPDKIIVDVARPMTITWTLNATFPADNYFNPGRPIEFKPPEIARYFRCSPDQQNLTQPRSVSCINEAPKGEYKYGLRTKGPFSPPDQDPTVVNN